jgi:hypothetical protein
MPRKPVSYWVGVFRENVIAQTDTIWNQGRSGMPSLEGTFGRSRRFASTVIKRWNEQVWSLDPE